MSRLFLYLTTYLLAVPLYALAQNYSTLLDSPLSGTEDGFSGYLNTVYAIAIGLAALLAVVKVIVAGVKYMLSDIVTSKETAKKEIKTALLGLVIIISAVMVLSFINPRLTNFDFNFEKLNPTKNRNTYVGVQPANITEPEQVVNEDGTVSTSHKTLDPSVPEFLTTNTSIEFSYPAKITYLSISAASGGLDETLLVVNPTPDCRNYMTSQESTSQGVFDTCMTSAKRVVERYCNSNYGIFSGEINSSQTSVSCQLPTQIRQWEDFSEEFEAYKASVPQSAPNYYTVQGLSEPTDQIMRDILCPAWNSVYMETGHDSCVRH
jgi:hypothetical protein